ncbi:MAG: hypothetical protein PHI12_08255 [Dehalococcoidales bacterium]|nr:hypothetical protein [Dehalococcoidales bacterium]
MKILDFKTISPFFEQCRDGLKPFDIRLIDNSDSRFQALANVTYEYLGPPISYDYWIRFTNPATGEQFTRQLLYCKDISQYNGIGIIEPPWLIMYLGDLILGGVEE